MMDYASHEMCVKKAEFKTFKSPCLPLPYKISDYDMEHHDEYINLLERCMRHVISHGTTPYLDGSDNLKILYTNLQDENRFHSLWFNGTLCGIGYSNNGEIEILAVDENHRGKGLGYYLLFKALENAFIYRDGDICLYVVDQNPDAFEFYKRCGMGVTGHSARYIIEKKN